MAVDDALGPAGRARRVTHGASLALIDLGPLHRLGAGDQRLVIVISRRRRVSTGDDDDVIEVARPVKGLEHLKQGLVDDDRPVLRVVDDEAQLVRMQPRVEGVQHGTHRRDREVELEVLRLVPQQRRHRVARPDAEAGQRGGEPAGARGALSEGCPADRPVRTAEDDLALGAQSLHPLDDVRHRERIVVHHQAFAHESLPELAFRRRAERTRRVMKTLPVNDGGRSARGS